MPQIIRPICTAIVDSVDVTKQNKNMKNKMLQWEWFDGWNTIGIGQHLRMLRNLQFTTFNEWQTFQN